MFLIINNYNNSKEFPWSLRDVSLTLLLKYELNIRLKKC